MLPLLFRYVWYTDLKKSQFLWILFTFSMYLLYVRVYLYIYYVCVSCTCLYTSLNYTNVRFPRNLFWKLLCYQTHSIFLIVVNYLYFQINKIKRDNDSIYIWEQVRNIKIVLFKLIQCEDIKTESVEWKYILSDTNFQL